MTSLIFVLMMQFVVSTKAGLVNYVQGTANVRAATSIPMGVPIRTGPEGFAEILLNPGSYLRLGQNSEAMLEGIELVNVSVRLVSGTAVIEASGFDKETPLKVMLGDLKVRIIKDGIYAFKDGRVKVVEGQIQVEGSNATYKKGWDVSSAQAAKAPKGDRLDIEIWSRNRSNLIAVSNANISNSIRRNPGLASSFNNVWLWDPSFGGFTFMPGYRYRSPYGYRYQGVYDAYYGGGYGGGSSASSGNGGGGGGGTSNTGGGNTASNGGSGSTGGGFTPAPRAEPAPAQSRPSVEATHDARPVQP